MISSNEIESSLNALYLKTFGGPDPEPLAIFTGASSKIYRVGLKAKGRRPVSELMVIPAKHIVDYIEGSKTAEQDLINNYLKKL